MNLASALIKQVLALRDLETWSYVRKDYLASQYHTVFAVIDKHYTRDHKLPTFEEIKLEVRDSETLEKFYAIESIEVDVEASTLLEYLKN